MSSGPASVVVVATHNARKAVELHRVLDPTEEPVGRLEPGRVAGVDVAAVAQRGEGGQRPPHPEGGVERTVHELEELHRELDVADAARGALDVSVSVAPGRGMALGPCLHGPHLVDGVGVEGAVPEVVGGGDDEYV